MMVELILCDFIFLFACCYSVLDSSLCFLNVCMCINMCMCNNVYVKCICLIDSKSCRADVIFKCLV